MIPGVTKLNVVLIEMAPFIPRSDLDKMLKSEPALKRYLEDKQSLPKEQLEKLIKFESWDEMNDPNKTKMLNLDLEINGKMEKGVVTHYRFGVAWKDRLQSLEVSESIIKNKKDAVDENLPVESTVKVEEGKKLSDIPKNMLEWARQYIQSDKVPFMPGTGVSYFGGQAFLARLAVHLIALMILTAAGQMTGKLFKASWSQIKRIKPKRSGVSSATSKRLSLRPGAR